jgi:hypothetical protein
MALFAAITGKKARAGGGSVHVIFGPEFPRVVAALREIDKGLPTKLRKDISDAVKPSVRKAQANMRAMPVKGRGHSGLRAQVARGIKVRVSLGSATKDAKVRIITTMQDASEAAIPRGFNSPKGWRHPVFGDREDWVVQHGMRPGWFMDPMQLNRDYVKDKIKTTLDEAAQYIADQGGTPH